MTFKLLIISASCKKRLHKSFYYRLLLKTTAVNGYSINMQTWLVDDKSGTAPITTFSANSNGVEKYQACKFQHLLPENTTQPE